MHEAHENRAHEELDEYIARLVKAAPPLTQATVARLRRVLSTGIGREEDRR